MPPAGNEGASSSHASTRSAEGALTASKGMNRIREPYSSNESQRQFALKKQKESQLSKKLFAYYMVDAEVEGTLSDAPED